MQAKPPTPKGRRTLQQILDAAAVVFGQRGYANARVSDIASGAGLSLGAFYRYFRNKEDVFEQVVARVHEELFESSSGTDHDFVTEPFDTLWDANFAYLDHYSRNRGVMRALIEASASDPRFQTIWWQMRARHAARFEHVMNHGFGTVELGGVSVAAATDAMTCMVEQVAYVWYANAEMHSEEVTLEEAAEIVTRAWFRLFFADPAAVGVVRLATAQTNTRLSAGF